MLQPQLQPMHAQITGASTTSLLQRYSFVRLCTLAATQHRARQHMAHTAHTSSQEQSSEAPIPTHQDPASSTPHQLAPDSSSKLSKSRKGSKQATPSPLPPPPVVAGVAAAEVEESPSSPTGIPSDLQALLPQAGVSLAVAMLQQAGDGGGAAAADGSRAAIALWCDLLSSDPDLLFLPAMQQLVTHLHQHTATTTASATLASTSTQISALTTTGAAVTGSPSCHSVECAASSMASVMRLAQAALRCAALRLHVRRLRVQLQPLVAALTDTASIPGSLASHAACANERHKLRQIALDVLQA